MGVPFRLNRWLAIRAPGMNRNFLESHRKSVYGDPEKLLRDWGRLSPPEGRLFREDPQLGHRIVEEMREGYRQGIDAAAVENRALYTDWGSELTQVEVPVALFYGDADKMAPSSWGRYLESRSTWCRTKVTSPPSSRRRPRSSATYGLAECEVARSPAHDSSQGSICPRTSRV